VPTGDTLDQRILADALARLENRQSTTTPLDLLGSSVWRTMMRSNWTKLAAAVLLVAIAGTLMSLRQTASTAYALEQTLEANRGLRYVHLRFDGEGGELREAWAEFDEKGQLARLRMDFPKTEDGAKEVLWENGKAEVWLKTKGHAVVLHAKEEIAELVKELAPFDPKVVMEQLHQAEAKGKVEIETQEPSKEGDPITLVADYKDAPGKREIYRVNPVTKLVEQRKSYLLVDGEYKLMGLLEYLSYNEAVPEGTFVLDIPPDALRVDWTTQEVGLAKGDLTNEQIAVKVAREFFEALIAKDYNRAGKMFGGLPGARLEQAFGKMDFVRIVSIGEPTPHPDHRTRFLRVPCEVEIRMGEETRIQKFTPSIRANECQPDRWAIDGGI